MDTKKASKISFEELIFSSWSLFLKCFGKIVILMLLFCAILLIFYSLGMVGSYASHYYWLKATPIHALIILYNFITQIFIFIIFLGLSAVFQILLINILKNPTIKFFDNLKLIRKNFWQFIFLSIIISLATLIVFLPILVIIFITLLKVTNILFLTAILFVLAIALAVIFSVYLTFTPVILIDKNVSAITAIKNNIVLVKNNFFRVLGYLLLLWILLGLINSINYFITAVPVVNVIFNLVYLLVAIPFIFIYLFNLYKLLDR